MHAAPALDADDSQLFWLAALDTRESPSGEHDHGFSSESTDASLLVRLPPRNDSQILADGGIVLLLDGELFDTRPLTEAIGWGSDERGASSAELLLNAYRARGTGVFEHLYGEFAILVWSQSSGDLILARDPLGARSLTYGERDGQFFVSPSPHLLVDAGVLGDINRAAIAEWILTLDVEISETFYARVKRVPPGHLLERRRGRLSVRPYWRQEVGVPADPGEAHEEFDRLLRESVSRGLGDRRAGVFLSGGIDSAAVAAVLAEESARSNLAVPLALSMRFPDPSSDESSVQRSTAAALALPMRMTTLAEAAGSDGVLIAGLRMSTRSWLPPLNPWAAAYDALALEGTDAGCRLLVTGEGGNLLLEPSWDELSDLLSEGRIRDLSKIARAWIDYAPSLTQSTIFKLILRRSLVRAVGGMTSDERSRRRILRLMLRRKRASFPTWCLPDPILRNGLLERQAAAPFQAAGSMAPFVHPESVAALFESTQLQSRRLDVSIRHPYFDTKLFAFRAQLPLESVLFGGRHKGLGQATYERRARGRRTSSLHAVSFWRWFGSLLDIETPAALRHLGGLTNLESLGIIQHKLVCGLRSGSNVAEMSYYQRWQILACEAWLAGGNKGRGQ